ncbi:hypothetical protein GAGA_0947 [Paraglaciecola agarilytica NO2]|uniref:Uncharacterized protein n=1 Tax=Paraglaciecola agarilytica NO2 TaxID=1125747 RepID=A0ABQ0I393_9ALTE|nr:hypothetical protein GAGA_0947 [Paraglaciecola agarilytica NO2]
MTAKKLRFNSEVCQLLQFTQFEQHSGYNSPISNTQDEICVSY